VLSRTILRNHRDGNSHAHKNKSCLKTIFA
jgi:hypothetical protein